MHQIPVLKPGSWLLKWGFLHFMPVCSPVFSAGKLGKNPDKDWLRKSLQENCVRKSLLFFRAWCNLQFVPVVRKQSCADPDSKATLWMFPLFSLLYLASELADLCFHHLVIRRVPARGQECPCYLWWECHKEELEKGSLTSVIKSRGSAHPPLSLIHSCCAGAAHLNTDVCNLLGLQGPDHHHVHVAKLVSPNVLQANPWGPCLCPWD